jgi:spore coat protein U-like protein
MGPGGTIRPAWRLAIRVVFLSAALAAPARAQETATARMGAVIEQPVIVINTADMDFGQIAYTTSGGTVTLTASASATCTTTGGLIRTGTCRAATFEGDVRFLFLLQVQPPAGNGIDLDGPDGATMRLDNFTFGPGPGVIAWGANRFLIFNLGGSYTFYTGGTLHVGANQTPGVYRGTFEVVLNYD